MRRSVGLILAILLAGCAATEMQDPPGSGPTSGLAAQEHGERWTLPPRGSQELNFRLDTGDAVSYRVNASAPITWDLHSHEADGKVTIHRSGEGREASGGFEAPAANVYSIFARASGSTTIVTVNITGAFEIDV